MMPKRIPQRTGVLFKTGDYRGGAALERMTEIMPISN